MDLFGSCWQMHLLNDLCLWRQWADALGAQNMSQILNFLGETNVIYLISWNVLPMKVFQIPFWCVIDAPPLSCWILLYHQSMQLQSQNPSKFWLLILENKLERKIIQKVPWHIHICQKGVKCCFWYQRIVQRNMMVTCSQIQSWKICHSIQFGKDILNFRHRPSELPGDFV